MSNDWSNGLCSCFGDFSTCKLPVATRLVSIFVWSSVRLFVIIMQIASLRFVFFSSTGIITWFVPCYTFGKNAEQLGESCVMYGLSLLVPILNLWCRTQIRGKIREQKGIEGSCIKDLLCVMFCDPCALIQEARVRCFFASLVQPKVFGLYLDG